MKYVASACLLLAAVVAGSSLTQYAHNMAVWGEPLVGAYVGTEVSNDGVPARAAVPREWHVKNRGGSDGAGLCVYASAKHTGLVQGDPVFAGMFEWMFNYPGGSYPSKFKKSVETFAKVKGYPVPLYVQIENADWSLVQRAAKSGRVLGVTYSRSPTGRYGGRRIAHMVSLCHADGERVAILDNNYPGSYEWMTEAEGSRAGILDWVVVLLTPGRPPMPLQPQPQP